MDYKEKVLSVVRGILAGKVLSYKKVAELSGRPKTWRAVGNILNKNQNPKVPCHRVIRADNRVGGYKEGQKKKITLLKKEGVVIKDGKVLF